MNARPRAMTIFLLSLVVIVGIAVGQPIGARAEEQILIPYGAGGYRYQVVEFGKGFGFEQPEFDDTAFTPGDAGFGTPGNGCELNSGDAVNTTWDLRTDILVRREFELPIGTTNLVVNVAIDNDVQVFINGHDVSGGLQVTEGCANWDSLMFAVPDGLLNAGTNLLAVRGRDRGVLAFLDIQVTAELSTIGRLNSANAWFAQGF